MQRLTKSSHNGGAGTCAVKRKDCIGDINFVLDAKERHIRVTPPVPVVAHGQRDVARVREVCINELLLPEGLSVVGGKPAATRYHPSILTLRNGVIRAVK